MAADINNDFWNGADGSSGATDTITINYAEPRDEGVVTATDISKDDDVAVTNKSNDWFSLTCLRSGARRKRSIGIVCPCMRIIVDWYVNP